MCLPMPPSWPEVLVPDLKGNVFSFCPLNMMLAVGLSYMVFVMLRCVPCIPIVYHKWVLDFITCFHCIY